METVYDWITLGIFAGLVVLFLQRSTSEVNRDNDNLAWYLAAGVGCGLANYLGNHGKDLFAIMVLAATVALIIFVLKPFSFGRQP